MPDERISLLISAKDQASSVLGKVQGAVIGIGAAYLGWRGVKDMIGSIADATMDADKANTRLRDSIERSGQSWDNLRGILDKYAGAVQQASIYDDELVKTGLARLTNFGFKAGEAMDALAIATDLAAAKEMDLMSAVDLLAKAHTGNTTMLQRYIGKVQEGATPLETFKNQMTRLKEMFGGAAAAELHTYSGRVQELTNAWNDFLESIGEAATSGGGVGAKGIMAGLSQALREIPHQISLGIDVLKAWWDSISTIFSAASAVVADFGHLFGNVLQGNIPGTVLSFEQFKTTITAQMTAVSAALGASSQAFTTWMTNAQWGLANVALAAGTAGTVIHTKATGMVDDVRSAAQQMLPYMNEIATSWEAIFPTEINTTGGLPNMAERWHTMVPTLIADTTEAATGMSDAFDNAFVDVALNSAYRFASTVNDVLWGMEATAADVFRSILKDFTEILLNQLFSSIALSLVGAVGGGGILGALTGGVLGKTAVPAVAGSGGGAVSGSAAGKVVVQQFYGVTSGDFINKDVLPSVSLASKRRQITVQSTNNIRFGMSKVFR